MPLTEKQAEPYWEQSDILASLMRRWEAQGWLSEIDQRRIMCCLQNMRMLCDSTFLFDKQTHHSPKLAEFREIIRELALEENRKVVVFSEYERMTYLAGEELRKMGIRFLSLHGGVPSRGRGKLIEEFDHDPGCKVFLSTDAGGVGLNLQVASAVINFEPPWNPARLEQRIGRVHRLGQKRPVQVVHLLTRDSIEERVWETLSLKKSLFAGIFDSPTAEVSFAKLGRKSMMQAVKEIFANQPGRLKPVIPTLPPQPISVRTASPVVPAPAPQAESAPKAGGTTVPDRTDSGTPAKATSDGIAKAAVGLLEAGLTFLESLGTGAASQHGEGLDGTTTQFPLSALFHRDQQSNRTLLAIPLPASVTKERLGQALAGLVSALQTPR